MISYMKTNDPLELLSQEEHDRLLMADWNAGDHRINRELTLAFEERNQRQALADAVKKRITKANQARPTENVGGRGPRAN